MAYAMMSYAGKVSPEGIFNSRKRKRNHPLKKGGSGYVVYPDQETDDGETEQLIRYIRLLNSRDRKVLLASARQMLNFLSGNIFPARNLLRIKNLLGFE